MSNFAQKHKHHLALWIVLVLIAAASGYVGFVWQPAVKEQVAGSREQVIATTTLQNDSRFTENDTQKSDTPGGPNTFIPLATSPVKMMVATLSVNGKEYRHPTPQNSTVLFFMEWLRAQTDFTFSGKDFGGQLGFFVKEINGVKSGQNNKFWIYYINGKKAQLGISNYIIQPEDIISWKYEDKE